MKTRIIRGIVNTLDRLLYRLWIYRFKIGIKLWGVDFQQRQISQAPMRYIRRVLVALGARIESDVSIKPGITIDNLDKGLTGLSIGPKVYVGPGVMLDMAASIVLEAEVVLAPRVMILTHGDVGQRLLASYIVRKEGSVICKRGCWIGAGAVILPGITIGEGAIVGAGAIVTRNVSDYTVVAGNPALEIRKIIEVKNEHSCQ